MKKVSINIPAKINLSLKVIKRLPNNYHQVEMVMQSVDLYDLVTLEEAENNENSLSIIQSSKNVDISEIPLDNRNLALKAYNKLAEKTGLDKKVKITIEKNIPVAGGMAGGSSNAGAVLILANELFDLGLSLEQLMEIGGEVGSDIPFCIMQGTALASGTGTTMTELKDCPKLHFLVINPGFPVSTKDVYENIDFKTKVDTVKTNEMLNAIENSNQAEIIKYSANELEQSTFKLYPKLAEIKDEINSLGLKGMMSGSGPTMLGISSDLEKVEKAYNLLKDKYSLALIASSCSKSGIN